MSTEAGTKRDVAAARGLMRHLDQGQTRWLSKLASPLPPALDFAKSPAVEQIEALGEFDPTGGFNAFLVEPRPQPRNEPLGIGARPRSAIVEPKPASPNLDSAAPFGSAEHVPRDGKSRDDEKPKRLAVEPDAAARETRAGGIPGNYRNDTVPITPRNQIDTGLERSEKASRNAGAVTPSERTEPASASERKPISKARRVADARRALAREVQNTDLAREPGKHRASESERTQKPMSRTHPRPSETTDASASPLESAIRRTLRNAQPSTEARPARGAEAREMPARLRPHSDPATRPGKQRAIDPRPVESTDERKALSREKPRSDPLREPGRHQAGDPAHSRTPTKRGAAVSSEPNDPSEPPLESDIRQTLRNAHRSAEPRPAEGAEARKALAREKPYQAPSQHQGTRRAIDPVRTDKQTTRTAPVTAEIAETSGSRLESTFSRTPANTHLTVEPQVAPIANPALEVPPTPPGSQQTGPEATHEGVPSTALTGPVRIDGVTAEIEPVTPSPGLLPGPTQSSRAHDDLAQQLADAARLHGVDLA